MLDNYKEYREAKINANSHFALIEEVEEKVHYSIYLHFALRNIANLYIGTNAPYATNEDNIKIEKTRNEIKNEVTSHRNVHALKHLENVQGLIRVTNNIIVIRKGEKGVHELGQVQEYTLTGFNNYRKAEIRDGTFYYKDKGKKLFRYNIDSRDQLFILSGKTIYWIV